MDIRQVARKAPDIAEIYAFNLQHEQYRQQQFSAMLDDAESLREVDQTAFESFQEVEEARVARHNEELWSVETFEREALETQQYADGNAFEIIAEMQGVDLQETHPYTARQLQIAPPDTFADTLTDVVEGHLQEELTNNKRSITPWKEKVRTTLIPQEEPPQAQEEELQRPMPDTAAPELSEEQIQAALQHDEELQEAPPAAPVLFFRPPTKPKR